MTLFYCVRHGKTVFNQNKTLQGGLTDSPLLPEGHDGAKLVGNHLKEIPFDLVIVSPQKRAQDTAQHILDLHQNELTITTINDLREMEFGSWDGFLEADFQHEEQFQHLVHRPHLYDATINGGEIFQTVINRSLNVFKETAQKYPEGKILVVAHGLLLQTLLKSLQGVTLADIRKGDALANTSVSLIASKNGGESFTIELWNDTSFL